MEKDKVYDMHLRPLIFEDFHEVKKWSQDPTFCEANDWPVNRNENELSAWWLRCVEMDSSTFLRLGIDYQDRLIGYVDLAEQTETSTELGIAIGDSTLWQKGIGTRAAQLAIEYASKQLGIHLIKAETAVHNIRAQKMLERLGFEMKDKTDTSMNYIKIEMP